jgi:tetratricopeptide (TPR) repeat protein
MTLKKRYDQNQKYLYNMKKWILELKTEITERKFVNRLDGEYSVLTSMEDDDLARATKILKQRENSIRELISEYNIWVNEQNANNRNKTSANKETMSTDNSSTDFALIGMQNMQNREYAPAIRNFSKYLETDKNNTDILFLRALSKSELGDLYGAISDYDKVIELNSNYPMQYNKVGMAYNNKAYSYVKLKEYNKALSFVEKALELDKSEWYFWDTRGEIYLNLGDYKKSISDLDKALSLEKNPNSYFLRGLAYIKSGQKVKGCKDLSKAGEMGNDEAYTEIGKNCN